MENQYTVYTYTNTVWKTHMNTFISTDAQNNVRFFSTNAANSQFEMRFWSSIAKLQEDNRWLCIVAPKKMPSKQFLTSAGIRLNRMLVIHTHEQNNISKITEKALRLGKCCAVVSWFDRLTKTERESLITTAHSSNASCIMVKPTANECIPSKKMVLAS